MFLYQTCRALAFSKLEQSRPFSLGARGQLLLFFSDTEGVSHLLPKNMSQYPWKFPKNWHDLIGIFSQEDYTPASLSWPQSHPYHSTNLTPFTKFLEWKDSQKKKNFFLSLWCFGFSFALPKNTASIKENVLLLQHTRCSPVSTTIHSTQEEVKPDQKLRCYTFQVEIQGKARWKWGCGW